MAPTLGKFYVKASKGENYGLWGNFKVGYLGNELAHVDRGLYGANGRYVSQPPPASASGSSLPTPSPPSRDGVQLRGVSGHGGIVYFLRHQDILQGSERVRVEIRDKDSGIVTGVVNLRPVTDYDIDYLQGRCCSPSRCRPPDDNLLVRTSGLSGDEAHLVVRYEYTPASTSWTPPPWAGRATTGPATTCASASPPTPTRKGMPTASSAPRTSPCA